jgi:hypothetical protein
MDIKKTLLEKIETEHVTPISQWKFLVRGYGLWVVSGILLIFGSLGVASVLYIITKNDWDIYSEIHESRLTHIICTLPFLWLALFGIMIVLLYIDLKHTKHGYKYNAIALVLATFAASVCIGGCLHAAGFGEELDELIREKAPRQAHIFNPRMKGLSHPEKGVLMGRVTIIEPSTTTIKIYIENPLLKGTWIVITEESTLLPPQGIKINDRIRVLGEEIEEEGEHEEEYFLAHVILPFNKIDKGFRKGGDPPLPRYPNNPKPKNLPN